MSSKTFGILAFALVVISTLVVFSGIDLILPAIPDFPRIFNTDVATAQMVIAAYTAGSALGLLLFGVLGAQYDRCLLLSGSLFIFAICAFACTLTTNIYVMIALRFFQGLSSAASGVFAPSIVKAVFDEAKAMRAIGFMGSIESIMPALAPLAGAWLLIHYGWTSSFVATAAAAALMASMLFLLRRRLPMGAQSAPKGTYRAILRNRDFLRYALSQAFCLGGLVVFVFGAPVIFVNTMDGHLGHFIVMQISGVAMFMVAANLTGHIAPHFGIDRVIWFGTALTTIFAAVLLVYALMGGSSPSTVTALMIPVNLGFGLRGPISYFSAIQSAKGDDTRASALAILMLLVAISSGTAIAAPFLEYGPAGLAGICLVIHILALASLAAFRPSKS